MENFGLVSGLSPKKVLFSVIVVLLGIFLALILLEILFSKFLSQKTFNRLYENANNCWQNDPELPFTLKENCEFRLKTEDFDVTYSINSQGFRGPAISIPKEENEFQVVVTGDSFIFGQGLTEKQTLTKKLKLLLDNDILYRSNKNEVINAGFLGGLSPDGHFINLKKMIKERLISPDLVIMSLYIFNDIAPDMDTNKWIGVSDYSSPTAVESETLYVNEDGILLSEDSNSIYETPLLRNSNLAIFLSERIPIVKDKVLNKIFQRQAFISESNQPTDDFIYGIQYQDCIYGEICHRRIQNLFEDLTKIFKSSKIVLQGAGDQPKLLVLIIPVDFQIYPDAVEKYGGDASAWSVKNAHANPDPQPQKRIREMLENENIDYIDLLPIFRNNPEPRMFFSEDAHWNEIGTALAANAIYNWVKINY